MKRTTRSRFDPNNREEDNNLQEDQLPENGATLSSVEPNSPAKPPSEQSLTPKIESILDNNVYEVPIKVIPESAIFLMCLGGSRLNRNRRFSSNVDSNNILLTRELTANRPLLDDSCTSAWSLSVQTEREPSSSLQLLFGKNPSSTVFTASKIADEEKNPLQILVVDDQMVPITNLPYPIKVEIVVLDGDFQTGEDDNWTEEEFENNILRQLTGRRRHLLAGEVRLTVRDGSATIGDVEFTESSSWIRSKKFRLGARVIPGPGYQGLRIHAAVTEAFVVKDHRGEHHLPRYLSHTRNNSV